MSYESGKMSHRDSWVSFSIYLAPFDDIFPLAVGSFRARNGAVILHDNEKRSPFELDDKARTDLEKRKDEIPVSITIPGILVAEPINNPGITIIEEAGNLDIFGYIAQMAPEITCLGFESLLDTKNRQRHSFAVRRYDENLREVCASQNTEKNGWHWENYGKVTQWENPTYYEARYPRQRLDRTKLFEIASTTGFDPYPFLNNRQMARATYIERYNFFDPETREAPSEKFMDKTRHAVSLGIGEMDDDLSWEERKDNAMLLQAQHQGARAFDNKVRKAKTVEALDRILRDELAKTLGTTRDWDKYRNYEILSKFQRVIQAAHRIDLDHLETRRLEAASLDHANKAGITNWRQEDIDEQRFTIREIMRPKLIKIKFDKMLADADTHERLLALAKVATSQEEKIRHEVNVQRYLCDALGKAAFLDNDNSITDKIADILDTMNAKRHPRKLKVNLSTSIRRVNDMKKKRVR